MGEEQSLYEPEALLRDGGLDKYKCTEDKILQLRNLGLDLHHSVRVRFHRTKKSYKTFLLPKGIHSITPPT